MNRTRTIHRVAAIALLTGLVASGCSKGNEVGTDITVDPTANTGPGRFDPNSSTTAPPTTEPKSNVPSTTAKPKPTTTVAPEKPCTQVKNAAGAVQDFIAIGTANTPYDPRQAIFRKGSVVCWKNTDSTSHQIEANNGVFRSGPIAPGAVYRWVANVTPGKINYGDPDRPFAVGEVIIQ